MARRQAWHHARRQGRGFGRVEPTCNDGMLLLRCSYVRTSAKRPGESNVGDVRLDTEIALSRGNALPLAPNSV
ncbi:hypothetical protein HZH66_009617 [Vespula vulgaris]|uniref:Uncharacterized protein n=1 Tax=Vespula vulgaris TaxID=7454 RepID=A0A834JPW8_VESVU|nr:hypothetical protein HZH66_009617 [Vespula vulgaris]